ncbi:MAG: hypothetical protein IJH61_02235, partial [Eubacteriaceae bacterium]|nr:hypothetical protein [Eubacteriaceae bacterium]
MNFRANNHFNRKEDNSAWRKRIFISFVLVVLLAMISTATAVLAQDASSNATTQNNVITRDGDGLNAQKIKGGYVLTSDYTRVTNKNDGEQKNYTKSAGSNDLQYLYKTAQWTNKDNGKADISVTSRIGDTTADITKMIDGENVDSGSGAGSGSGSSSATDDDDEEESGSGTASSDDKKPSRAVYVLTACTAHGDGDPAMKRVFAQNILDLKKNYDIVDIACVTDSWGGSVNQQVQYKKDSAGNATSTKSIVGVDIMYDVGAPRWVYEENAFIASDNSTDKAYSDDELYKSFIASGNNEHVQYRDKSGNLCYVEKYIQGDVSEPHGTDPSKRTQRQTYYIKGTTKPRTSANTSDATGMPNGQYYPLIQTYNGDRHWPGGIYRALYQYLRGSDEGGATMDNLENKPDSIFVSFDTRTDLMYTPSNETISNFNNSERNIWPILQDYQARGRYFCVTSKGSMVASVNNTTAWYDNSEWVVYGLTNPAAYPGYDKVIDKSAGSATYSTSTTPGAKTYNTSFGQMNLPMTTDITLTDTIAPNFEPVLDNSETNNVVEGIQLTGSGDTKTVEFTVDPTTSANASKQIRFASDSKVTYPVNGTATTVPKVEFDNSTKKWIYRRASVVESPDPNDSTKKIKSISVTEKPINIKYNTKTRTFTAEVLGYDSTDAITMTIPVQLKHRNVYSMIDIQDTNEMGQPLYWTDSSHTTTTTDSKDSNGNDLDRKTYQAPERDADGNYVYGTTLANSTAAGGQNGYLGESSWQITNGATEQATDADGKKLYYKDNPTGLDDKKKAKMETVNEDNATTDQKAWPVLNASAESSATAARESVSLSTESPKLYMPAQNEDANSRGDLVVHKKLEDNTGAMKSIIGTDKNADSFGTAETEAGRNPYRFRYDIVLEDNSISKAYEIVTTTTETRDRVEGDKESSVTSDDKTTTTTVSFKDETVKVGETETTVQKTITTTAVKGMLTFISGKATIYLDADTAKEQEIRIKGLPAGMSYTVTEANNYEQPVGNKNYAFALKMQNEADMIPMTPSGSSSNEKIEAIFTNTFTQTITYGPKTSSGPVTLTDAVGTDLTKQGIYGFKKIKTKDPNAKYDFHFQLIADPDDPDTVSAVENGNVILPEGTTVARNVRIPDGLNNDTTPSLSELGTGVEFDMGGVKFKKPGTYHLQIKEVPNTERPDLYFDVHPVNVTLEVIEHTTKENNVDVKGLKVKSITYNNDTPGVSSSEDFNNYFNDKYVVSGTTKTKRTQYGAFSNSYLGSLTINTNMTGNSPNSSKKYYIYEVTLYANGYTTPANITGVFGNATFSGGVAKIVMPAGASRVIRGSSATPLGGYNYKVKLIGNTATSSDTTGTPLGTDAISKSTLESTPTKINTAAAEGTQAKLDYTLTTASQPEVYGSFSGNNPTILNVTNERNVFGNMVVRNYMTADDEHDPDFENKLFQYTVKLKDKNQNPVTDVAEGTSAPSNGKPYVDTNASPGYVSGSWAAVPGSPGEYTFTIKGGINGKISSNDVSNTAHQITIKNLENNSSYTITQEDYSADGYGTEIKEYRYAVDPAHSLERKGTRSISGTVQCVDPNDIDKKDIINGSYTVYNVYQNSSSSGFIKLSNRVNGGAEDANRTEYEAEYTLKAESPKSNEITISGTGLTEYDKKYTFTKDANNEYKINFKVKGTKVATTNRRGAITRDDRVTIEGLKTGSYTLTVKDGAVDQETGHQYVITEPENREQVQKIDESNTPVVDENGNPVMIDASYASQTITVTGGTTTAADFISTYKPARPSVTTVAESLAGRKDGSLEVTSDDFRETSSSTGRVRYQYRKDGESTWKDIPYSSARRNYKYVNGLAAGTYYVRVKPATPSTYGLYTDNETNRLYYNLASDEVEAIIASGADIVVDNKTDKFTGMSYGYSKAPNAIDLTLTNKGSSNAIIQSVNITGVRKYPVGTDVSKLDQLSNFVTLGSDKYTLTQKAGTTGPGSTIRKRTYAGYDWQTGQYTYTYDSNKDWEVRPSTGLDAGVYAANIQVTYTMPGTEKVQVMNFVNCFPFTVDKANRTPNSMVIYDKTKVYDGEPAAPEVGADPAIELDETVTYEWSTEDGSTLEEAVDVGDYIVKATVSGKNYNDMSQTGNFKITPIALTDLNVNEISVYPYTGSPINPSIVVTSGGKNFHLTFGKDYKASIQNNVDPGEATITITGLGNFDGEVTKKFNIVNGESKKEPDFEPTIQSRSATSITLTPTSLESGDKVEYGILIGEDVYNGDDYLWQTDTNFTGLKPETKYTFALRAAGDKTGAAPSKPGPSKTFETQPDKPDNPEDEGGEEGDNPDDGRLKDPYITYDYIKEEVKTLKEGYSLSDGANDLTVGSKVIPGQPLLITHGDSQPAEITVPERPIAPGVDKTYTYTDENGMEVPYTVYATDKVNYDSDAKAITGVTTKMEYRASDGEWKRITAEQQQKGLSGLATGLYEIRYLATETAFASDIRTIAVNESGEAMLTADPVEFDKADVGYTPDEKAITISNNSDGTANIKSVTVNGDKFVIDDSAAVSEVTARSGDIPGNNSTYKIKPVPGLSAGAYSATITIVYTSGTSTAEKNVTANVSFIVTTGTTNTVTVDPVADQIYTGEKIKPEPVVKINNMVMTRGQDYTVTYGDNTNVGKGTFTVNFIGLYDKMPAENGEFNILPKTIADSDVTGVDASYPYTGSAIEPTVKVTVNNNGSDVVLTKDADYTVDYQNKIPSSYVGMTGSVTVKGTGNYTGEVKKNFDITLSDAAREAMPKQKPTLKEAKSTQITLNTVTDANRTILYAIADENGKFGTPQSSPVFTGLTPDKEYTFALVAAATETEQMSLPGPSDTFRTISKADETGEPGETDYSDASITYKYDTEQIRSVDTANYTVTDGTTTLQVGSKVTPGQTLYLTKNGSATQTAVKVPARPAAPSVSYKNGKIIGLTTAMEISSDGGAKWDKVTEAMAADGVTADGDKGDYMVRFAATDTAFSSEAVTVLVDPVNNALLRLYMPSFDAVNAGYTTRPAAKAITIENAGLKDAVITKAEMSGSNFTFVKNQDAKVGAGDQNTGYTLQPKTGLAAGTYKETLTVTYTYHDGTQDRTKTITGDVVFEVRPANAADIIDVSPVGNYTYSGARITPIPTVTKGGTKLTRGTDYDLSYGENLNAGTGTVTVTFKGETYGSNSPVTQSFNILKKDLSDPSVTVDDIGAQAYNGFAQIPAVTVMDNGNRLENGYDYTVDYHNNINETTDESLAEAVITAKAGGNYTGSVTKTFSIIKGDEQAKQDAPTQAPTLSSASSDTITLKDEGEGYKYGLKQQIGYLWQSSNVFTGLTPDTNYTFVLCRAGDGDKLDSDPGPDATFATTSAPGTESQDGVVTYNYVNETVKSVSVGQLYRDANCQTLVKQNDDTDKVVPGSTLYLKNDENVVAIKVPLRPAAPKTDGITYDGTDHTLTGLTADMQVSIDGENWANYNNESYQPGQTVFIRNKAKENVKFASESAKYTIPAADASTVVLTASDIDFGTVKKGSSVDAKVLKLTNTNTNIDATVTGVTLTGASVFSVNDPSNKTVNKNSSNSEYKISANTATAGVFRGTATITYSYDSGKTGTAVAVIQMTVDPTDVTNNFVVGDVADVTYTGKKHEPTPNVTVNNEPLTADRDFKYTYGANTNAGEGTVAVNFIGSYAGNASITKKFKILPVEIKETDVDTIGIQTYTGSAVEPPVTVTVGEVRLAQGVDYTVTYDNNINETTAGNLAKATITGVGNAKTASPIERTFQIVKYSDDQTTPAPDHAPVLKSRTNNSITLEAENGVEYGIKQNGAWQWQAKPVFTGLNAETAYTFALRTAATAGARVSAPGPEAVYKTLTKDGQDPDAGVKGSVKITYNYEEEKVATLDLTDGYSLKDGNNSDVGEGSDITPGQTLYVVNGSNKATITVPARPAAPAVTVDANNKVQGATTDMQYSTDGTTWIGVPSDWNPTAGNYRVRTKATGTAFASESAVITITPDNLTNVAWLTANDVDFGSVANNALSGKTETITLKNIGGQAANVTSVTLSADNQFNITPTSGSVSSDGEELALTVKPKNDLSVGAYDVIATITYKTGNDGADQTVISNIRLIVTEGSEADQNKVTIEGVESSYDYTGSAIKPEVTVKKGGVTLTKNGDYTVTYGENTNAGANKGSVKVDFIGSFAGTASQTKTFNITPKTITDGNVGDIANQVYNGKKLEPALTVSVGGVSLVKDRDYTVTYTNDTYSAVSEMKGHAIVTGLGNYTGSVNKTFNIIVSASDKGRVPEYAPTLSSKTDTSITLVTEADGIEYGILKDGKYQWQSSPVFTGLDAQTTYTFALAKAGNNTSGRSSAGPSADFTTEGTAGTTEVIDDNPQASVTYNYADETIKSVTGGFDVYDGDSKVTLNSTKVVPGQTLYLSNDNGQTKTGFSVPTRPAAPKGVSYDKDTLSIQGVSNGMQYSKDGGQNWTDVKGSAIGLTQNDLSAGTYLIRTKATDSAFAGESAAVLVAPESNAILSLTAPSFGTLKPGYKAQSKAITLRNLGGVDATNINVSMESGSDSAFSISGSDTSVKAGGTNSGYTLNFAAEKVAGTYTGTIKVEYKNENGNTMKTVTAPVSVTVSADDANTIVVGPIDTYTYTGSRIKPVPAITKGRVRLASDQYTLAYGENTNVGTGTVKVSFNDSTPAMTLTFTIAPKPLSDKSVKADDVGAQTYTGKALTPDVIVMDGAKRLVNNTDYALSYDNNTKVTTDDNLAKVTVTGQGNYTGSISKTFAIVTDETKGAIPTQAPEMQSNTFNSITLKTVDGMDYGLLQNNGKWLWQTSTTFTGLETGSAYTFALRTAQKNGVEASEPGPTDVFSTLEEGTKPIGTGAVTYNYKTEKVATITDGYTLSDGTNNLTGGTEGSSVTPGQTLYLTKTADNTKIAITVPARPSNSALSSVILSGNDIVNVTSDMEYRVNGEGWQSVNVNSNSISASTTGVYEVRAKGSNTNKVFASEPKTINVVKNNEALITVTAPTFAPVDAGYTAGLNRGTAVIANVGGTDATVNNVEITHTGSADAHFTVDGFSEKTLAQGESLNVTITPNEGLNPGLYTDQIVVTYDNGKTVRADVTFQVKKADVADTEYTISNVSDAEYTGSRIKPVLTVKAGSMTLTENTDYTVAYGANTNVGIGTVHVQYIGLHAAQGSKDLSFNITPHAITNSEVADIPTQAADGSNAVTPTIKVTYGSVVLSEGTDYTVNYSNNTGATTSAKAEIIGKGNYTGTVDKTFKIVASSTAEAPSAPTVTYPDSQIGYDQNSDVGYFIELDNAGNTVEYAIKKSDGSYQWQDSTRFTKLNSNTAYTFVQRFKANGDTPASDMSQTATFITKAAAGEAEQVTAPAITYDYINEKVATLNSEGGYTLSDGSKAIGVGDPVTPGQELILSKDGNNTAITVPSRPAKPEGISYNADDGTYGSIYLHPRNQVVESYPRELQYRVIGDNSTWQDVTYNMYVTAGQFEPTQSGTYEFRYKATNDSFAGETFSLNVIRPHEPTPAMLSIDPDPVTFDSMLESDFKSKGSTPITLNITNNGETPAHVKSVTLKDGSAFKLNNSAAIDIAPKAVNNGITVEPQSWLTTGTYTDEVIVTYTSGTSSKVNTRNVKVFFSIRKADIVNKLSVGYVDDVTYNGTKFQPTPTVECNGIELVEGYDYDYSYGENINAGTGTVTVTFMGNYENSDPVTKTFTINPKVLTSDNVDTIGAQHYTGAAKTPEVTVIDGQRVLVKDTDYTVSYENNVNNTNRTTTSTSVEPAYAVVTGIGNYTGVAKKSFQIVLSEEE